MSRPADIQSDCEFSVQNVLQYFLTKFRAILVAVIPFGLRLFLKSHVVLL